MSEPNNSYEMWRDVIEELDASASLEGQSQDFIIRLVEEEPPWLSSKQIAWLQDLQRRYLA
jgi:hypothetical protein